MPTLSLTPFSKRNANIIIEWRNSNKIRKNMLNDSIIKEDEHDNFLENLENDSSKKYYLVSLDNQPVAALYLIDIGESEVTWGCYIGAAKIIPGLFPALFVSAGSLAFYYPETNVLRSEVAENNDNPIKLNRFLGIPISSRNTYAGSNHENRNFFEYKLEKANFESAKNKAWSIMPKRLKDSVQNLTIENIHDGHS